MPYHQHAVKLESVCSHVFVLLLTETYFAIVKFSNCTKQDFVYCFVVFGGAYAVCLNVSHF